MISKVTLPVIFCKDTTFYLSSLDLDMRMKCLVCTIIFFSSSAGSQASLFDSRGGSGDPQNNLFSLHTFDALPSKVLPPAPSRLLHHRSNCLIKECWIICISTELAHPCLTPHPPSDIRKKTVITYAASALLTGHKPCWANTQETSLCVLTATLGAEVLDLSTFVNVC